MSELIKYALKKGTNEIVHIDSVPNGLKCDCMCPYCKEDMEARQGNNNDHSFAHAKGVSDCGKAGMTILHLIAQQIIEEEKSVGIPGFNGQYNMFNKDGEVITFETVELEKRDTETNRRADCECNRTTDKIYEISKLWVEIKVTHEVDDSKLQSLQREGIDCIEIDLSNYTNNFTRELISEVIHSAKHTKWINPATYAKVDKLLYEENTHSDSGVSHYVEGLPNFPRPGSMPLGEYYDQMLMCIDIYYQSGFYNQNLQYYRDKKARYEALRDQYLNLQNQQELFD